MQLVSNDKINDSKIKSLKQVLGTVFAGGQYQIIIGNKVSVVYKAIQTQMQTNGSKVISLSSEPEPKVAKKESLVSAIFGIISGSFLPLLGLLAGAGMLKALLMLSDKFGLLSQNSDTFILLSSIANAPFYFLPILLGFSLAKRLDVNPFMGAAIGAALLEPGFMSLIGSQELYFLGIQVIPLDYSASVFPVFIAVLYYAWFEKLLIHEVKNAYPNTLLEQNPWGWSIDPTGLQIVLNEYWGRWQKPIMITENGLGCFDKLDGDKVQDDYRIDFFRQHIKAIKEAIKDGVNVVGYFMWWSPIDIVSCSSSQMEKRYGLVFVDINDYGQGTGKRYKKESFSWYKKVIETNGEQL